MWNVGLYTSPILATVLYRRGYFVLDGIVTIAKFLTGIGLILAASYCLRGIGRANNHAYISFLNSLTAAKKELNKDTKVRTKMLNMFDVWTHGVMSMYSSSTSRLRCNCRLYE